MTDKYELSRRKTLAGLATIGAAGAGAGLGTSALFSDEESFTNNSIQAGTLDMNVTATIEATNDYWSEAVDASENSEDDPEFSFSVSDVKPGDWGIFCFDIQVDGNPSYIRISVDDLVNAENGYTEPEPETEGEGDYNDPGVSDGAGELADEMIAEVYGDFDESLYDDTNDYTSPRDLLNDLQVPTGEDSTVQDTFDEFSDGVILADESEGGPEPITVGDGNSVEYCLLLWLPDDVGNNVQTDKLGFDLVFQAEQERNNEVPFDGDSAVSNSTDE